MVDENLIINIEVSKYNGGYNLTKNTSYFCEVHKEFCRNDDGSYNVSGKTTLYDFERYFKTDIPEFQESDIITVGGFMIEQYPNIDQDFEFNMLNFHFKVAEFDHGFVNWFKVTVDKKAVTKQDNLASLTDVDDLKE